MNFINDAMMRLEQFSLLQWLLMAFAALFVLRIVQWAGVLLRFLLSPLSETHFEDGDYERAFRRCCVLFPIDRVLFKNEVFTRGTTVRITTAQGKSRMGRLVGSNKENFICLITSRFVSAEMIDNVIEIITVDESVID